MPERLISCRPSRCRRRASPSVVERRGLRVWRKPIVRTPPCPSPQRGQSCFRLRAPLQARRHGPLPLLSLLRSGRGVAGPVSCGSCSLKGSHRVVMSASPLSGTGPRAGRAGAWHHPFGSARTTQCRTLCPDVRVRLKRGLFASAYPAPPPIVGLVRARSLAGDRPQRGIDLVGIDTCPQRSSDRTPLERPIQTRLRAVEVGTAPGQILLRINHEHTVGSHHADEFCFVAPLTTAGAGACWPTIGRATHR